MNNAESEATNVYQEQPLAHPPDTKEPLPTMIEPAAPDNPSKPPSEQNPDLTCITPAPNSGEPQSGTESIVPGYEVLSELGRGGMGVVYRARQIGAKREVALKMILNADHAGTDDVSRFRAEAEAIARLQHPSIVTVFEVGEHSGRPFFSMELCTQGSLAVDNCRPTGPQAIAALLLKVANGVAAAHAAGVIHRDLKPGNILITTEGEPKIADFGLSKRHGPHDYISQGELTATGAVLGTPSYMAPEQASSARDVGPPADVYALGSILYDLLTGHPPFRGSNVTETLLMLMSEDPRPPRELFPEIPRDLEAICLCCLEKDPGRRYPTAAELAADLSQYIEGEPVSAVRAGIVDRIAGALDRVQFDERWSKDGILLITLAPVMLLPELGVTAAIHLEWPNYSLAILQFGRICAFVIAVGSFRGWHWRPLASAERQLWSVWIGYVAGCLAFAVSTQLSLGFDNYSHSRELKLYQGWACLAGLAFWVLAQNFWGYCAVIGLAFFGLSFLMALNLQLAPIEFGLTWAVVLIIIGFRLQRMGQINSGEFKIEH